MRRHTGIAKLQHVRQHHDLWRCCGYRIEGGRHRGRPGVVAVIDNRHDHAIENAAGDCATTF